MSEFAPGSPWKAIVLLAALPPPRVLAMPRTLPTYSVNVSGGCFARRIAVVNPRARAKKPRYIRNLRLSAARAEQLHAILLATVEACYSARLQRTAAAG